MTDNPSFFKKDISPALLASVFIDTCEQTCELEQNKKDNDDKKQKAVGAAVDIRDSQKTSKQKNSYLSVKKCLHQTNKDVTSALREMVKLWQTAVSQLTCLKFFISMMQQPDLSKFLVWQNSPASSSRSKG
jgi:hypothetical protein